MLLLGCSCFFLFFFFPKRNVRSLTVSVVLFGVLLIIFKENILVYATLYFTNLIVREPPSWFRTRIGATSWLFTCLQKCYLKSVCFSFSFWCQIPKNRAIQIFCNLVFITLILFFFRFKFLFLNWNFILQYIYLG